MNEYDELQVSQMFGIPLEWFKEVDAACDAWLKRHGMKTQSIREQIYFEQVLGKRRRDFRIRNTDATPANMRNGQAAR